MASNIEALARTDGVSGVAVFKHHASCSCAETGAWHVTMITDPLPEFPEGMRIQATGEDIEATAAELIARVNEAKVIAARQGGQEWGQ